MNGECEPASINSKETVMPYLPAYQPACHDYPLSRAAGGVVVADKKTVSLPPTCCGASPPLFSGKRRLRRLLQASNLSQRHCYSPMLWFLPTLFRTARVSIARGRATPARGPKLRPTFNFGERCYRRW